LAVEEMMPTEDGNGKERSKNKNETKNGKEVGANDGTMIILLKQVY
jgi:hypothetical protein